MKHRGPLAAITFLALATLPAPAHAQSEDRETQAATLEGYLERLGLSELLANQLESRLAAAPRDQRQPIAERLASVYAQLLSAAETPDAAQRWEKRSRDLLAQVPDAESFELRINLNKAIYLKAEETAERSRLRLTTPEEVGQAEASLKSIATQSRELGSKLHARVLQLEKLEATLEGTDALSQELADARRLRSLAFYYAGWASAYLAMLSKSEAPAIEAMKDFGWLLNASGGKLPTVDKAPAQLMKYEHIARAALGCAMCASIRGNDVEALRWLELVSSQDEAPAALKEQLAARRMVIFASAKRWADLERTVRLLKRVQVDGQPTQTQPLSPLNARLLAVLTLEADKRFAAQQIESLAKTALGDLVARKEAGQVLDLVRRYGTAPLGDTGFIVHYVRGLQQYDQARSMHEGADADPPRPPSAEAANAYRAAAGLLEAALRQDDAESFGPERVRAMISLARARLHSGEVDDAIELFAQAFSAAGKNDLGEEALWLAVLAADRRAKETSNAESVVKRRAEIITMYLQAYPESPKAPRLVLLQASAGELNDDGALRVLSGVGKGDATYEAARRQIARILYSKLRTAKPDQREFAITRFVAVAEEVLTMDLKAASTTGPDARAAGERVVGRVRQLLDAILFTQTPDVARAQSLLDTLRSVAREHRIDLAPFEPELMYRGVQIVGAKGDDDAAISIADQIAARTDKGGPFGASADRVIFRRLVNAWNASADTSASSRSPELAQRLVRIGVRVIDRLGNGAEALKDPAALNAYAFTADAALSLAESAGNASMRELALRLDSTILSVQPRLASSLRRLARSSELAGDLARARQTWTSIAEATPSGSPEWFESRYQVLRLLSSSDPASFRSLMDQQRALYPDLGPEPWGSKMRDLDASVPATPATPGAAPMPTPPPAPAPAPPASGSPADGRPGK